MCHFYIRTGNWRYSFKRAHQNGTKEDWNKIPWSDGKARAWTLLSVVQAVVYLLFHIRENDILLCYFAVIHKPIIYASDSVSFHHFRSAVFMDFHGRFIFETECEQFHDGWLQVNAQNTRWSSSLGVYYRVQERLIDRSTNYKLLLSMTANSPLPWKRYLQITVNIW